MGPILPMAKITKSESASKFPGMCFLMIKRNAFFIIIWKLLDCIRKFFQSIFSPSSDQRLINLFKQLSRIYGAKNLVFPGYKQIQVIFTPQELADLSISKVNNIRSKLEKLKRRGFIKFNGRFILVRKTSFRDFCN